MLARGGYDSDPSAVAAARAHRAACDAAPEPEVACIIDFEATCVEDGKIVHEIVEWPVVVVDLKSFSVIDQYREYIRPVVNPVLSSFCTQLTGITQRTVDAADTFEEVLDRVTAWMASRGLAPPRAVVATDGPWDLRDFLRIQCTVSGVKVPALAHRWFNIRKAYSQFYKLRGGIQEMLSQLGMRFEGQPHSGLDDSLNLARILIQLAKDGCPIRPNDELEGYGTARLREVQHELKTGAARLAALQFAAADE